MAGYRYRPSAAGQDVQDHLSELAAAGHAGLRPQVQVQAQPGQGGRLPAWRAPVVPLAGAGTGAGPSWYDVPRSPVPQPSSPAVEKVLPQTAVAGESSMPSRGTLLARGKAAWEALPPRPEPPDPDGLGTLAKAFPDMARPQELGSKASYDGHRIFRGDREIARVLRKEGEAPALQLNSNDGPGLWDKTVLGDGPKDTAVYLGGIGGRDRKSPAQAREWKSQLIAAVAKGPAPGAPARVDTPEGQAQLERAKEIERLGGLPEQIRDSVRRGDLPRGDGEEMMQKLWGKTLKPQDPRSPDHFREWLGAAPPELQKEWFGAMSMGDVDAQNALMNLYVNDWYRKNSSQPGVTRDLMRRVREDLTGKEAGNFKEKFTGAVNGLNNFAASTVGSMAGMIGGIDEDVRNARLAPFSATARAKLMEKMKIRGRGTTNTLRGWAHFIDKNNPFSDTGRKDQEAQYALGDLKRAIDVLDLQQGGWKAEDQKKIGEAMAAAREKVSALHEVDQEQGFGIGRDDVDAAKDPVLFQALNDYVQTGDPNAWQRFRDRMFADQGTRQLEQQMEEKLRGMNPWQAAYTGGANMDFANLGVEAASTLLTAGLGKALGAEAKLIKAAQGVGKGAARGGGVLARIGELGKGLAGAGEKLGGFHRLGKTLAPSGKLGKAVGNWLKETALEAPIGAATEAISEAGDKRATGESMWKAAGTGLLAEAAMGPVMAGTMRALKEGAKLLPAAKANAEFADYHRARMAGNPEARELSQEDVDAATGQMDAERYQALVEEPAAAQREQEAARGAAEAEAEAGEPITTSVGDGGAGRNAAGQQAGPEPVAGSAAQGAAGSPPAAAPVQQGEPGGVAARGPAIAGGSTASTGDGAVTVARPSILEPRGEQGEGGGMALVPVPDRTAGGRGDAPPPASKSPALPAEAGGAAAAVDVHAPPPATTTSPVDEAGPRRQIAPNIPQTSKADLDQNHLSGEVETQNRGKTASSPPAAEASLRQPRGESGENAARGEFAPTQEGRETMRLTEGPAWAPRDMDLGTMPGAGMTEASDGVPQGREIDSAPMLGLRFEPWDEYSYREAEHPAARGDERVPRGAAHAFQSTLRQHYGASGVRLLRVAGQPGSGGSLQAAHVGALIGAFERAFGKRVVFYRASSAAKPLPQGGLSSNYFPNYIAVNADGPFSVFFVLGHELGHAISRQQPELYAATKNEVLALLRDKDSYIAREGLGRWYQAEKLDNEVFNDVLGHFFRDARFWQELGQRNGGLTAKVFTVFAKVVEKMLAAFQSKRGGRDAEGMLADHLVEIRKKVADMVDEYRRRGEFPAFVPERPSRGTSARDGGASAVELLDGDADWTTPPIVDGGRGRGELVSADEGVYQNAGRTGATASPSPSPSPSREAAPGIKRPRVTRADVHAAATAPDARRRLGDVRAGRLHALEAYRFLSDKLRKKGSLDPAEKVKYERAAQALAHAVGKEAKESLASSGWLQGPPRPEDYSTDKLERYMQEGERSELLKSLAPELLKQREALANATRAVEGIKSQPPSTKPKVPGGPPDVSAMLSSMNALEAAKAAKGKLIEASRALVAPLSIFSTTIGFEGYPHLHDLARQGAEVVYRYVRGDLLPTKLSILHDPDASPGHLPGEIRFNERHSPLQVGHEIMHEVEIRNKAIHAATVAFFERRTKTGGFRMLSEYTGKKEHAEVKVFLDKWDENGGSEYAGRLYPKEKGGQLQATEILTVGLERLHENPVLFLLNDPEYFELIITLIHNR